MMVRDLCLLAMIATNAWHMYHHEKTVAKFKQRTKG